LAAVGQWIGLDPFALAGWIAPINEFGCSTLTLIITGQTPSGRMTCGKSIGRNGELRLTGSAANAS
jgi:hypothetical protein